MVSENLMFLDRAVMRQEERVKALRDDLLYEIQGNVRRINVAELEGLAGDFADALETLARYDARLKDAQGA